MAITRLSDIHTLGTSFYQQTVAVLPRIAIAIVLLILFYIAAKIVKWALLKSFKRFNRHAAVRNLLAKTVQTGIMLIGLVTALGTAGVNVSALVASLGLMSFAIGFAFKDLLTNTLAGVLILVYKPFKVGDTISGTNFDGVVQNINLRYVQLNNDKQDVLIPNATILTTVVNVDKQPAKSGA
ncbi:MAG: mechanosensitive ion channel [Coxiellaceae bacterium]|nr:mechanosensitive ion channel [Coxiellaceae bacterium]